MYTNVELKKSNNEIVRSCIVIALSAVQVFALFANSNRNSNQIRLANYMFFALGIMLFLVCSIKKKNNYLFPSILALVFYLIYAFVFGCDFDCTIKYLNYWMMISAWVCARNIVVDNRLKKALAYCTLAQSICIIMFSFGGNAYAPYVDYTYRADVLTLGFNNPNETGIIIFCLIALLISFYSIFNSRFLKFLFFAVSANLIYLLVLTDARTSIASLILLIIWRFFFKNTIIKNIRKSNVITVLIVLLPLAFVPLYLNLFSKGIFSNIMIFDKKFFSGRQRVYAQGLLQWNNYLFGNMNSLYFANAHNGLFTILINTGILGLLIYLYNQIVEIRRITTNCYLNSTKIPISLLCIYSLFFMSSGEAAILVSGNIFYYYFLVFAILCNYESEEAY